MDVEEESESGRVTKVNTRLNMIQVYMHVWKCHNENNYFVQLRHTTKEKRENRGLSVWVLKSRA
jgi:hypothetical protein